MVKKIETIYKEVIKEEREKFYKLIEELWDEGKISAIYVRAIEEMLNFDNINMKNRWNIKDWVEENKIK